MNFASDVNKKSVDYRYKMHKTTSDLSVAASPADGGWVCCFPDWLQRESQFAQITSKSDRIQFLRRNAHAV